MILKKLVVSMYAYISILYTALAFGFRWIVVFGLNKFINIGQAISRYHDHYYNIYLYIIICILYFIVALAIPYYHISGNNIMVMSILSLLSLVLLHVAAKSWGYIESVSLSYRFELEEDYKITINILCLSLVIVPLFIGVLLTTGATNGILIYIFLMARIGHLDEYEMTAHDCMHKSILTVDANDIFLQRVVIKTLYYWYNYVIGVLFLYPPHFYYYHHMYNHHRENCGPEDVTSPIFYSRNSISGFCRAALRFTLGWVAGFDLIFYLVRKGKFKATATLILGMVYFYSILYLISLISPLFAIALLLQHAVDGFMLAITIWRWHGFIDPTNPQNSFKNTTNIIFDSPYTYAYHSVHHQRPGMHYCTVDEYLSRNKELIIQSKMLLLRNVGTSELVSLILTDKLDIIAQHVVNLDDQSISLSEIKNLLYSRVFSPERYSAMPCYFQSMIDRHLRKVLLLYNQKTHGNLDRNFREDRLISNSFEFIGDDKAEA